MFCPSCRQRRSHPAHEGGQEQRKGPARPALLLGGSWHKALVRAIKMCPRARLTFLPRFPPSESSNEPLVHVSRSLAGKLVKSIRFEPSQRASIECIRPLMPNIGTPIVMDDTVRAFTRTMALEIGFGIKLPRELIDSHQETKQLFSCVQDLLKLFDSTKECTVPFPFLEWLLPRRTSQKRKEAAEVYERFQHAASALSKQHDGHIRKGEGLLTTASQYHLAKEGDGTPDGPLSEQESVIQGAGIIAAVSGRLAGVYR